MNLGALKGIRRLNFKGVVRRKKSGKRDFLVALNLCIDLKIAFTIREAKNRLWAKSLSSGEVSELQIRNKTFSNNRDLS